MDCPYTPNFLVVNLASQAEAISAYVNGWPHEHIVRWLSRQGDLRIRENEVGEEIYSFRSRMGFESRFLLEGDRFTFIEDGTGPG